MIQARSFSEFFRDQAADAPPALPPFGELFVSSIQPQRFLSAAIEQRASYLPEAVPHPSRIFDSSGLRAALRRALEEERARPEFLVRLDTTGRSVQPAGTVQHSDVSDYASIGPELDRGATLCVSNLHTVELRMSQLALGAQRCLGFTGRVGVNCYLSSADCGFAPHFDARVVTVIQLEGSKRWRYTERPGIAYPRTDARLTAGEVTYSAPEAYLPTWQPQRSDWREVTLHPGDVLCLPAGAWHAAQASGASFALNVYFEHPRLEQVIAALLGQRFLACDAWRRGPCGSDSDQALDYYRNTLNDAAAYLREVATDVDALNKIHRAELQRAALAAWGGGSTLNSASSLETELLRASRYLPVSWFWGLPKGGAQRNFFLDAGAARLEFSEACAAPIVSWLTSTTPLDLTLIAPPLRDLALLLVQAGALEPVSEPAGEEAAHATGR